MRGRASAGHIHALYVLAQFREPATFPRILRLFRLPDEAGVRLTGDVATDGLHRMLATLNGGDVASIQGLLEDPGVSEWVRGAARPVITGSRRSAPAFWWKARHRRAG